MGVVVEWSLILVQGHLHCNCETEQQHGFYIFSYIKI